MKGLAASIAARLRHVALKKGVSFQYATLLYTHEGMLRRLSGSSYRAHFALKGGLLLQSLSETGGRTTKDIDLLGSGIENDAGKLASVFSSIAAIDKDDGLKFDAEALVAEPIVEGADYHGVRIRLTGYLGTIRNSVQIDIGFGDKVDPPIREMMYHALVGGGSFSLYAYPLPVVIAEKFETMISLAHINSRMKDFWDVAFILDNFDIREDELRSALEATFTRRQTPMPKDPLVFSEGFIESERAQALWTSFLRRSHLPDRAWSEVWAMSDGEYRQESCLTT